MDKVYKELFEKLDQIIEDPKKTKEVIRFCNSCGLFDESAVVVWSAEIYIKEHKLDTPTEALDYGASDYM